MKSTLGRIAAKYGVKTFEDGRDTSQLKMFSVYLCSADGLFTTVEKRIWHFPGKALDDKSPIYISVFAYKADDRWYRLSKDVDSALRKRWPDQLRTTAPADSRLINSMH